MQKITISKLFQNSVPNLKKELLTPLPNPGYAPGKGYDGISKSVFKGGVLGFKPPPPLPRKFSDFFEK